jgi:hypothetical protein
VRKERPHPTVLYTAFVFGLFLVGSAAQGIWDGETTLVSGAGGARGAARSGVHSVSITRSDRPILFWSSVSLRLALGVPALVWGGFLLFWPERKSRAHGRGVSSER